MAIGRLPYTRERSLDLPAVYRLPVWHGDRSFLLVAPGISGHDAEAEIHSRGFDGGMNSLLGRGKVFQCLTRRADLKTAIL